MKALYVTSVEPFSGKTAICLGLGHRFQDEGYTVGYLKPVSTQPWRTPDGTLADEDAAFVQKMLGLEGPLEDFAPVIVTAETFRARLRGYDPGDLLNRIRQAAQRAGEGKDILLLEGGASLREGYAMGLSNLRVAEELRAPALVLVRYQGEMQVVDSALTARHRLSDQLLGVILNHIPSDAAQRFIDEEAAPFLQREGVPVLGSLPSVPRLSALSVGELTDLLEAEVLTQQVDRSALIETFTVGAMAADVALTRFRRQLNKAVITGGDRTDIQLAALETSTVALILTGNLRPSPLIIQQAEALDVPVLLVGGNTIETVEAIEKVHGKTRLGQAEKLASFMQLMDEHVNLDAIYSALGLGSSRDG